MGEHDDLRDAPEPVRQASLWLEAHKVQRAIAMGVGSSSMALGVLSTVVLHDFMGIGGLLGGAPLIAGVAVVVGTAMWVARGPLREAPAKQSLVQRYRALREMGLTLEAPSAGQEDRSAVDRLGERIEGLTDDAAVLAAVHSAQERAERLRTQLVGLDETLDADPQLAEQLSGVRERVETEISRIRSRLAETWAALIELDAATDGAEADLKEALARLSADLEVEHRADAQSRARAHAARVSEG